MGDVERFAATLTAGLADAVLKCDTRAAAVNALRTDNAVGQ